MIADDDPTEPRSDDAPPTPAARRRSSGGVLGAAMLGLHHAIYGPPKDELVIEIEASGDPPNIDDDGLNEVLNGSSHRLVGPPLDRIKSPRPHRRVSKRRRH